MHSGSSGGINGGYSRIGKTTSSGYGSGIGVPSQTTNSKIRTTGGPTYKAGTNTLNNRSSANQYSF
jgi:hypothetical protein